MHEIKDWLHEPRKVSNRQRSVDDGIGNCVERLIFQNPRPKVRTDHQLGYAGPKIVSKVQAKGNISNFLLPPLIWELRVDQSHDRQPSRSEE